MMNAKLTDADEIELESFANAAWGQDRTDEMEVGRWTNYGHDRLYINSGISKADKYSLYVDLETHEVVSDNTSKHKGGDVTIDGDTATITIIEDKLDDDAEHEIVVSLSGEEFEANDDGEDANEPEIVADGGECPHDDTSIEPAGVFCNDCHERVGDPSDERGWHIPEDESDDEPVDDSTIEDAIEQHDDPDHPDATTVAEVRDALGWVQQSMEEVWRDWLTSVENGEAEVVHEDNDVIVFATGEQNVPRRDLREHHDGELNERTPDVVSTIHHELARERCDYDWSAEYPLVVVKRDGIEDGERYTEAVVKSLLRRDLSPGQAWAYYGVEIRGHSRNSWAKQCGYSDHSAISEPLRKAERKLP